MGGVLGQCVGCQIEDRKHVGFIGPHTAKLAVVGEYPGDIEARKKEPFVGPAGRLLDLILQSVGIDRNTLRLGNALLCGPLKEEDKNASWLSECLSRCAVRREAEADLGEARVVVALGVHAATGLLGERIVLGGSRPRRGAVHRDPSGRIVIPTWNPAALLKSGGADDKYGKLSDADAETLGMDIKKAWRLAHGEIEEFKPQIQLESDPDRFADWCEWSIAYGTRVAIDVETDSADALTCKLLSVGLARRVQIDGKTVVEAISFWWPNVNALALDALQRLLASGHIAKTAHHCQFDWAVLERLIGPVRGGTSDTLLLSHVRFPDVEVKLDAVAHTWLAVRPWKFEHYARERERKQAREQDRNTARKKTTTRRVDDERQGALFEAAPPESDEPEIANPDDEDATSFYGGLPWTEERVTDLLEYNAMDSATTMAIEEPLVDECEREDVLNVAAVDVALAQIAWKMTRDGVPIDQEVRQQLKKDTAARVEGARGRLWNLVVEGLRNPADRTAAERLEHALEKNAGQFNPNSPVMLESAFDVCGVKVPASKYALTAKGKRSFGKLALAAISDDPLVSSLSEYRGMTVQFSTYFGEGSMGLGPDRRLHVPWKVHGTPTGRWASGKEDDADEDAVSINLQNWPKDMRRMVVAPESHRLVGADFCVAKGTRIATQRGLVPIEAIRPGRDSVIQEDGSFRKTDALWSRGTKPIIRIATHCGYEIALTSTHRLRVVNGDGDYVWKRASNLKKGDRIAVQSGRGRSSYRMKLSRPDMSSPVRTPVKTPVRPNVVFCELLGYLVGDGSFQKKMLSWVVNWNDADLEEMVWASVQKCFGRIVSRCRYRGVVEGRLYSVSLSEWLRELGCGKDRVPCFLFETPRRHIAAFVRGLFEADGSVSGGHVTWTTKFQRLSTEVQQLLLAVGVVSVRHRAETSCRGKVFVSWRLDIPREWQIAFRDRVGFISSRKRTALDRLVQGRRGRHPYHSWFGGFPNLHHKIRASGVTGRVRRFLSRPYTYGGDVSPQIARRMRRMSPDLYMALDLRRVVEYGTLFDAVESIRKAGSTPVYDLSVPGTNTYISNGFVSHNCQLEYRVVALLAGETSLLSLFNDPDRPDLHNTNAARLFGKDWAVLDPNEVGINPFENDRRKRKRKILRGLTKNGLYGAMYKGSAKKIQKTLQARSLKERDAEFADAMRRVSEKQCQDFVDAIPRLWPAIEAWRNWAIQDAIKNQQTVCPLSGRRRIWPLGMIDATQAVNTRVQTLAGSIMNERFLYLSTALPPQARIILQVHDSVVVECPEEMAQSVLKIVVDTMTTDLSLGKYRCAFPVDVKIGQTWAEV